MNADHWFYVNMSYAATFLVLGGYAAFLTLRLGRARPAGRP